METLKCSLALVIIGLLYLVFGCSKIIAATITIEKDDQDSSVSNLYRTTDYRDDAACIQAALDNAKSGDAIIIREGNYYIERQVFQIGKSLSIIGEGNVTLHLKTKDGLKNGILFGGKDVKTTTLSADAIKGSSTVILKDSTGIRKNDLIMMWKDVLWSPSDYEDHMTGEVYSVESVDNNVVTLNQPLIRDYPLCENSKAQISRPIEIHINNIGIQDTNASGKRMALTLDTCRDSSVSNCWIKDSGLAALSFYTCFNIDVNNNQIYNSLLPGSGYGVGVWSGTAKAKIHNNHIENCRHCITSNTNGRRFLNRDIEIFDNIIVGGNIVGANPIDAHQMTINYTVTGNKIFVKPNFHAFIDGSQYSVFSENEVYGGKGAVVGRGNINDRVRIIKDNYIEGTDSYIYRSYGGGIGHSLNIENNMQNGGSYGVLISNDQPDSFRNIRISGNTFSNITYQGVHHTSIIDKVNIEISNNFFDNIANSAIYINADCYKLGTVDIQNNKFRNIGNIGKEIELINVSNATVLGTNIVKETELILPSVAQIPIALFSATPVSGDAPLVVHFTDESIHSPTAWLWDFGDGTTSTNNNPTHTYEKRGTYTVKLTASNILGSNTMIKQHYITIINVKITKTKTSATNNLCDCNCVTLRSVPVQCPK